MLSLFRIHKQLITLVIDNIKKNKFIYLKAALLFNQSDLYKKEIYLNYKKFNNLFFEIAAFFKNYIMLILIYQMKVIAKHYAFYKLLY